ncbi:MAG: hypothetical protein LBE56_11830 [Tannerella sp.]|jgi:hypothetical protein|nr:hypothetical protein [Tannerella sp.]
MKKSNIILIALLASLTLMPAIVWGVFKATSVGEYYSGFGDNIRTVIIENQGLTKDDIVVDTQRASSSANFNFMSYTPSFLYYKGKTNYFPDARIEGDILMVGKALDATTGEKMKLHIRINNINEIVLNGNSVWKR